MKRTKITKTIVKDSGDSRYSMRSSLRGSGKVRKRTILGEKFDYGEKVKEKRNYIMYVSGQGQEKHEIQEIEEIPPPQKPKEKIVEEKEIIDNYQYHETKNLSKNKSKNSITVHQRLSTPFERTTIRRYESYTPEPRMGGYKKIEFSKNYGKEDHSNYSSLTSKAFKNRRDYSASNIYETYNPSRNSKNNMKIYKSSSRTNNSFSNNRTRFPNIRYENKVRDDIISKKEYRIEKENTSFSLNNSGKDKRDDDEIMEKEEYKIEKENTSVSVNNLGKNKSQQFIPQQVFEYEYQDSRKFNKNIPSYHQISLEIGSPQKKIIRTNDYYEEEVNTNERREEYPEISNQNNYEGEEVIEEREITQTRNEPRPLVRPRLNSPDWKKPNYPICRPFPLPKYSQSPKGYGVKVRKIEFRQKTSKPMERYMTRINKEYIRDRGDLSQRYEENYNYNDIPQINKISQYKYLRDLRSHRDDSSHLNRENFPSSSYRNINYEPPKFPGRGTRVGATDLEEKIGLDSDPYQGVSYSEYKKFEQKRIRNRENDDNQYNDDNYEKRYYNRNYENQINYNDNNYENQDNFDNYNNERDRNEHRVEHYEKRYYYNTEGNYDNHHHHNYKEKYENQNDYDNENMNQNYEDKKIYRNFERNDYNRYQNNNYNQDNLDYQEEYYERKKEIFCPIHGRQIVRINDEYE